MIPFLGTALGSAFVFFMKRDMPAMLQKKYSQPLAVEKLPLDNFYSAEEYHQDYLDKNPSGYCHLPKSLFDFARSAKV